MRRLLGLISSVSKFIPNATALTSPLRALLKKDIIFLWTSSHKEAFNNIKRILLSKLVLRMFDSTKPITIEADSLKDNFGICLLQDGHPVSFASRSLTEAEQKWAQIEKELMAICFGFQKFHDLVYGRRVTVKTDHKSLVF